MYEVHIQNVRCEGTDIKASRKYRLVVHDTASSSSSVLQKYKSDKVKSFKGEVKWSDPFKRSIIMETNESNEGTLHVSLLKQGLFSFEEVAVYHLGSPLASQDQEIALESTGQNVPGLRMFVKATVNQQTIETVKRGLSHVASTEATTKARADLSTPRPHGDLPASSGWKKLGDRLDVLLKLGDTLAELHPMAKLAWGVVSVGYKITAAQVARDETIGALVDAMADSCSFVDQIDNIKERSDIYSPIVSDILLQVVQCTYFVKDYCRNRSFGARTFKSIVSGVDKQIKDYTDNLQSLRQKLDTTSNLDTAVVVYRVLDDLHEMKKHFDEIKGEYALKDLKYSGEARLDMTKGCLPNTRTEIVDRGLFWATQADLPLTDESSVWSSLSYRTESRVLWICGVAGSGKTAIMRSIAARLKEMGRLGSYYAFSKSSGISSLFGTVAQDLAAEDPTRKRRLVEAIRDRPAVRNSPNVSEQFAEFILAPAVAVPTVGDTVVLIDGFDESAENPRDRAELLQILTTDAHKIPEGLKFIVTSRFEHDVQEALQTSPPSSAIDQFLLADIPHALTHRDIRIYVNQTLQKLTDIPEREAKLKHLAAKADVSFQWVSTACLHILNTGDRSGETCSERLNTVLQSTNGLDGVYRLILDRHFGDARERKLVHLRRFLGLMLCAKEPLPLRSLIILCLDKNDPDNQDEEFNSYRHMAKLLASLISGVHDLVTPIQPLHASITDFLRDKNRSVQYSVEWMEISQRIARRCLEIMVFGGLMFNICEFPTSLCQNSEIENLDAQIQSKISVLLSHSCRYWPHYVAGMHDTKEANVEALLLTLLRDKFLFWLEAMSLIGSNPSVALGRLSHFISPSSRGAEIGTLVEEATRFTSTFLVPIMESVPHIYISCLPFVPTTSRIPASPSDYGNLAVVKTGRKPTWTSHVRVLDGHSDRVSCIAWGPIGPLIASGSHDHTIRVWNALTGDSVVLKKHTDAVRCIVFSPDGKLLVSGSDDHTLILWDLGTNFPVGDPFAGHRDQVRCVAFLPSGNLIASGSNDKVIQLWDGKKGKEIGSPLVGHEYAVMSISFSADGSRLVSGELGSVLLWDIKARTLLNIISTNFPWCMAMFSQNDSYIAVTAGDCILRLDSIDGSVLDPPFGKHDSRPLSISFSRPDSNGQSELVSSFPDHSIRFSDPRTGLEIGPRLYGHSEYVNSVAYSPDGKFVVSGSFDRTVRVWSRHQSEQGTPLEQHTGFVCAVLYSPNGMYVATGSDDCTVRVWKADDGRLVGKLEGVHSGSILCIAYSPNGALLATSSADKSIQLWDMNTIAPIGDPWLGHSDEVNSVTFSPDGAYFVSGSEDCLVGIWNPNSSPPSSRFLKAHNARVNSVSFSPRGTTFASASFDGTLIIWDAKAEAPMGEPIQGNDGSLFCVAYSPDGARLAAGGWCHVSIWDVESRTMVGQPFIGHSDFIRSVSFSPSGEYLASGSYDETVCVWNWKQNIMVGKPLIGHEDCVNGVAFSPNGNEIVSVSDDRTVRIWDLRFNTNSSANPEDTVRDYERQYPSRLFPDGRFDLTKDGWIVNSNEERLLWIPHEHRHALRGPHFRIIHNQPTELDFQYFKYDTEWTQCYRGSLDSKWVSV